VKRVSVLGCAMCLAVLLAVCGPAAAKTKPATTVYRNGYVWTVDKKTPLAHAVAVRGTKIVYVGGNPGAAAYVGKKTKVVNLKGRMVLPGFADSHAHMCEMVDRLYAVNLYGLSSLDAYVRAVAEFASARPDEDVIRGKGWSEALFPGIGPRKESLDAVVSDRAVALWSDGHHAVWANSKALEAASIDASTPDPPDGVIERIPGTTEPSGTLRQTAADMFMARLPDYSVEQYKEGLLAFQNQIAGPLGLTLVHDPYLHAGSRIVQAYEELAAAGRLKLRVRGSLWIGPNDPFSVQLAAAIQERALHTTEFFQTRSVKFLDDGVIEGHTGYLLEPYADALDYAGDPDFRSRAIWDVEPFKQACALADAAGFQVHIHAIGDAAVKESVDALAFADRIDGRRKLRRCGITHLELVDSPDIARMAQMNIIAYPQPYWFLMDDYYDYMVAVIGQERADRQYPMRSLLREGVIAASSSDWPVTPLPDPLDGIQAGVMRWLPESPFGGNPDPTEVLWPEERVGVKAMISSFTLNGAYANYLERRTGSLEVGKSADLIVLDRNIITCAPEEIGQTKVLLTLFRGKTVYKDTAF